MEQQLAENNTSILVVDDNPLILNVLRSLFASIGYNVFPASNGKEALSTLEKQAVDVIVCDVMMPEMDGYDLHSTLRENAEYSHIPFVFLTALAGCEDRLEGKEAGVDDYVVKPFDPTELLAIVRGKVKRSRSLKESAEQRYDSYRKRVIHTLSHEFRTPLVAINTGTELLLEQEGNIDIPKINNLLQAIQRGGQRLERLVSDFMLLQQIEAGIARRLYEARQQKKDIVALVKVFIEAKKADLEEQGFKIKDRTTDLSIPVVIYEPQILDIFERFISNVVKFCKDKKEMEVKIIPLDEEVAIEFWDCGIGLNKEKIREAMNVFGQIDRDTLEQQGGGLGLAIADRYAALHSGRLEFENRSDCSGAVARLILPVSKI